MNEDATIDRFEPHVSRTAESDEPRFWAVGTRRLPFHWFPRDCPRGTFWAGPETTADDDDRFFAGAMRVHAVEAAWLGRIRQATVVAYRLPEASFGPDPDVGGYWLSRVPVEPLEVVELGDLLALHAAGEIELRVVASPWPLWDHVVTSTVEFSGMRVRNAEPRRD